MSCGYWKAIRRKELEKEKDLLKKKKKNMFATVRKVSVLGSKG